MTTYKSADTGISKKVAALSGNIAYGVSSHVYSSTVDFAPIISINKAYSRARGLQSPLHFAANQSNLFEIGTRACGNMIERMSVNY
ncbi:unnamed protein product [Leptidea sinapis]|uniref:Uncharacterized protein n=1 Tax=Leptidea sinapis TaxID=189913 RepID=A0A5E4QLK1_9NEOP|nr:unnamed protein product [Leptidea sinapis]